MWVHIIIYREGTRTRETIWENLFVNELVRLSQGLGTRMPQVTYTIKWSTKADVPNNKQPTYG